MEYQLLALLDGGFNVEGREGQPMVNTQQWKKS